jgi:hypothetical protein
MLNFVTLLILSLATWRISSLLTQEDGPWLVFQKIRDRTHSITTVLECVWCLSIWVAASLVIIVYFFPEAVILFTPFAISTVAILVDRYSQ